MRGRSLRGYRHRRHIGRHICAIARWQVRCTASAIARAHSESGGPGIEDDGEALSSTLTGTVYK